MGMPGHARGRYIQQDDAAFYRITSISCFISSLEGCEVGYCEQRFCMYVNSHIPNPKLHVQTSQTFLYT